jgi:hypothetical protein
MLSVSCPGCNKVHQVPEDYTGKRVSCPCGHKFKVNAEEPIEADEIIEPETEAGSGLLGWIGFGAGVLAVIGVIAAVLCLINAMGAYRAEDGLASWSAFWGSVGLVRFCFWVWLFCKAVEVLKPRLLST